MLSTFFISVLGYIDYITGEISIDILYIICLCVITWYSNILVGIICLIEVILAKTSADYFDHIKVGTHLYEWNLFNYFFIYLIMCFLVVKLKNALSK